MYKISATVILYNPVDDTYDNICSYAYNVEYLIVVDNSITHNKQLISRLENNFSNLIYINNNTNLGIATALNIGCKKAIECGSDWILTMDQDSKILNFSSYLQCLEKIGNSDNVAILAANTMWNATTEMIKEDMCTFKEKFLVITSANLLNLSLFNTIGGFEEKLFIDMVDHDYCIRAQKSNFKILWFENIIVNHSLGNLFQRKNFITRKIRNKIEHNPQRVYYITRNYLYTWQQYGKIFPQEFSLLKILNILFIHEITKIILYEDKKIKKIQAKFLGLFHFLKDKYGKYDFK